MRIGLPGWHTERVAKWREIADRIIDRIRVDADRADGDYSPGKPAPSVRGLMAAEDVSTTTARRVLDELTGEGWIVKVPDIGHFIAGGDAASLPAQVADHERRIAALEAQYRAKPDPA